LTFLVEASRYPDISIPKFMAKGLTAGSSVDAMFAELIGEDYMDGTGVSYAGILEVNGMIVEGWRRGMSWFGRWEMNS
jgi:hypothetical protein